MEKALDVALHNSENKKLDYSTYVLKGIASAGITALMLSRLWKPSLAKLSLGSLACVTVPIIPMGVAIGVNVYLNLPDNQNDWRCDVFSGFGIFSAGIVGGAQMAFLGGTAIRIWKGALSGLSLAKKIGIGLAISVSVTELVVMKGVLAVAAREHQGKK